MQTQEYKRSTEGLEYTWILVSTADTIKQLYDIF